MLLIDESNFIILKYRTIVKATMLNTQIKEAKTTAKGCNTFGKKCSTFLFLLKFLHLIVNTKMAVPSPITLPKISVVHRIKYIANLVP
jgi:hypothetical protein